STDFRTCERELKSQRWSGPESKHLARRSTTCSYPATFTPASDRRGRLVLLKSWRKAEDLRGVENGMDCWQAVAPQPIPRRLRETQSSLTRSGAPDGASEFLSSCISPIEMAARLGIA